ncbi:ATP-binding protein [Magnetospirillum sp. UT-4]|uniref:ATP-binding protein n=1 Tax=Magnetospirillum sp. UT-4 TaxID=2681467 RepID=UPI001384348A|nr:ATP-binding protein [Magnetospirillum sp. UT-4]CAA7616358.1 putative signal transduction histidine kinase [Magnetospirillum sp. UT-4]
MNARPPIRPSRVILAAGLLSVPAALALAVLVALARLSPLAAMAAWLAVLAATVLLVRPYLADLARLQAWVRRLGAGVDAPPPECRSEATLGDVSAAIIQLRRVWQAREGELAAAARWNETLFDTLPDPLVLLDEQRRVVRYNQAARRVFGRDIGGRDLAVVLRAPTVLEATDSVLAGATGREAEFTLPVPVERVFLVRVERIGISAPDGSVAILALHDLTQVRRIEQMRADFVANASHELRTPLATLLGFIETLRGPARDDSEARERFLAIMHDQASRMTRLVNDLLSLSRIELNEHSPPTGTVDIARLAHGGIEAMRPLAEAKGMTLSLAADPAAGLVVGQPDELAQVIQNLLDNAVKYGRDNTAVEVRLTRAERLPPSAAPALAAGGAALLAVRDHGEGIAKEHLPRLTERFYRVDTARSRKLGGTGLGLAIVKHIVNRHRGTLVVDSVPGQGSTFSVYLPLAEPEAPGRAQLSGRTL